MSWISVLAITYAVFSTAVIGFQVALICGAPWGRLTQGGQHAGPLPSSGRAIALLSIPINAAMALAILSGAGLWPGWPLWTLWAALGLQAVVTLLNWITPSRAERRLWAPVTSLMLITAGAVALGG